jgi:integrase/recombinase XerD
MTTTLRASIQDYLAMRRGLGFKLHDAGVGLLSFVSFMERRHACRITTNLALEWAQKSKSVLPAEWARRLSFVRGFARYRSAIDARTQIPPSGLLPYRPKRARPYFYSDQEIERLLAAALELPPAGGLKGQKYRCLFGLLSVALMRER